MCLLIRTVFAILVTILLTLRFKQCNALKNLNVLYHWNNISFVFDNDQQQEELESSRILIPGDSAPFDVDADPQRRRIFVAMPHVLPGSAVTLATVENTSQEFNPRLHPYPDWSWHANYSGCDGLTSVYRMQVDGCGRLWVLDSGVDVSLGNFRSICPPQLLVFNLTTDELITRHRFAFGDCEVSVLGNIVTELMDDQCTDDVYAYMADSGNLQIFIYHLGTQRSWRVSSNLFNSEITARNFITNGQKFTLNVGLLGLALSPCIDEQCDRFLFFNSVTGFMEGRVRTSVLRNESLFASGASGAEGAIQIIGNRPRQIFVQAMSDSGHMFFGLIGDNTLNCWNHRKPYNADNIQVVDYDSHRISILLGIKVLTIEGTQVVGLISTNMQTYFSRNYSANSTYPVYVLYGNVDDLVDTC